MTTETAGSRVPLFATVLIWFLLRSVHYPGCGGEMAAQFGHRCSPVAKDLPEFTLREDVARQHAPHGPQPATIRSY